MTRSDTPPAVTGRAVTTRVEEAPPTSCLTNEGSAPHVLREYALLADGERGALIGPRGDVAWLCAPRWDDDAVFSSLIGGRGSYAITPTGRFVWGGYYEDGGLIWRSRWVTDCGIVECRVALAFPGDEHRLVLLRRMIAVRGPARLRMRLEPAAGFGRHGLRYPRRDDTGCWHGYVADLRMRFSGAPEASVSDGDDGDSTLDTVFSIDEGAHHDLVFELADTAPEGPLPAAQWLWAATEAGWAGAIPALDASIASRDAQFQLDVFGEALLLFATAGRDRLDVLGHRAVTTLTRVRGR